MRLVDSDLHLSATDLSAHLGCGHRTQLERRSVAGELVKPNWKDPLLEVLKVRGEAHEKNYVGYLEANGYGPVIDLRGSLGAGGMAATEEAMKAGAGAIIQAPLTEGRFRGIADVLLKVDDAPSDLGSWSYRVVDTKLSTETRAGTVLQLCLYTQIVKKLQGFLPEEMWVVSPKGFDEPEKYRTTDYLAFARRIQNELVGAVDASAPDDSKAPEPVAECDICHWWSHCNKRRREQDHLSFVANISRMQRRELEVVGVDTLHGLADASLPLEPKPRRGSPESYERVHHQARVQRDSPEGAAKIVEFLDDVEEGKGLARLPKPTGSDIFFDLEGDNFVEDGGLEYLWGWVTIEDGEPKYERRWALDRAAEKAAFEEVLDLFTARWKADPGFHVYHFGAYEPSTLKRLMGRHATREDDLDQLLRGERFIDLHAVVREGLRIGIETYGLKQLEDVHGFTREIDLQEASRNKNTLERALELDLVDNAPPECREAVRQYNEDDCVSTWRLRDWAEEKRAERIGQGVELARPTLKEGDPDKERDPELQALMDALLIDVPEHREDRSVTEEAHFLLAHLLEWPKREENAVYWDFFRLADLPTPNLLSEKSALFGLQHTDRFPNGRYLPTDRYRFQEQDHDVRIGTSLHISKDQAFGRVVEIDLKARTVDVLKTNASENDHPVAAFAKGVITPPAPREALGRIARWVVANDIDAEGDYRAARRLLLRALPSIAGHRKGRSLVHGGETSIDAGIRLSVVLDGGTLPIQGPPGTGKTHTGARVVRELIKQGRRVGITGPSHKVVRNLAEAVLKAGRENGQDLSCLHKVTTKSEDALPEGIHEVKDNKPFDQSIANRDADFWAGTVWAWAREPATEQLDYLVIDEAGQMSLANAVAAAQAARNVILLGDPQQLEQPIKRTHPPGCDASVLQHLLGEHETMPKDRGMFLDTTYRLHPAISKFTSEMFYEGRLKHHDGCARQRLTGPEPFDRPGLWLDLVEHRGNASSSTEESERVGALVKSLLAPENQWVNRAGEEVSLKLRDVLVVAPYNAQVGTLKSVLPAKVEVGTVDRFQGREAPVVIYSMTTSSAEEAPRGLEFLLSLNRLNVATSRARCVCIVVASPALFEAECRSPRQMQLVNALCRYREMARQV